MGYFYLVVLFTTKSFVMNTSGKILAAVAAGIAAGAVLGILFAPDKGSETRRKINEQGKKFTDDVKDKFSKGKEKFSQFKEDIEKTVKEKVEEFA
jgi:gas vesicle protein